MNRLNLVPLRVKHIIEFLRIGRKEDIEEFELGGTSFRDTQVCTFANSLAIEDDHQRLFAIGGVDSDGQVWMLCTVNVERYKIRFLRYTKELLKETLKVVPRLYNCVWLKNTMHVRWLKWLGATFGVTEGDFQYFCFMREVNS